MSERRNNNQNNKWERGNNNNRRIVKDALISFVTSKKKVPTNVTMIPTSKQIESEFHNARDEIVQDRRILKQIYQNTWPGKMRLDDSYTLSKSFNFINAINYLRQANVNNNKKETKLIYSNLFEYLINDRRRLKWMFNVLTNPNSEGNTENTKAVRSLPNKLEIATRTGTTRPNGFSFERNVLVYHWNQDYLLYKFKNGNFVIRYQVVEEPEPVYLEYTFVLDSCLRSIVNKLENMQNTGRGRNNPVKVGNLIELEGGELLVDIQECISRYFNISNASRTLISALQQAKFPPKLYNRDTFKRAMAQLRMVPVKKNVTAMPPERKKRERVLRFLKNVHEHFTRLSSRGFVNSNVIRSIPNQLLEFVENADLLELKTGFQAAKGDIKSVLQKRAKLIGEIKNSNKKNNILEKIKQLK